MHRVYTSTIRVTTKYTSVSDVDYYSTKKSREQKTGIQCKHRTHRVSHKFTFPKLDFLEISNTGKNRKKGCPRKLFLLKYQIPKNIVLFFCSLTLEIATTERSQIIFVTRKRCLDQYHVVYLSAPAQYMKTKPKLLLKHPST